MRIDDQRFSDIQTAHEFVILESVKARPQQSTVDSEIFVRILFSRIAFKDILVM